MKLLISTLAFVLLFSGVSADNGHEVSVEDMSGTESQIQEDSGKEIQLDEYSAINEEERSYVIEQEEEKENVSSSSQDANEPAKDASATEPSETSNNTIAQKACPPKRVSCLLRNESSDNTLAEVKMFNGSEFLHILSDRSRNDPNVTNRTQPAHCVLTFFFASWCPFSAKAAPHFNGLARLFPDISMIAVDTWKYSHVNSQLGIMALPTLMLFHNGRFVGKYNMTEFDLENYVKYVEIMTGLKTTGDVVLAETDYIGPVPTKQIEEPNYYICLAWIFTISCALFYFGKSSFCLHLVESLRNAWREAEMHEHQD